MNLEKQAERIKRKEYYYSYVLVQKDAQQPELEGTVQIFRYPKAIKKIIDAQLQPEAEELEMGTKPVNVFDLFTGKDFLLKVALKGGYWNYDECKFSSSQDIISIKGVKMENNAESKKTILGIYEGLNDLSENEFKPWTDDTRTKVNNFLNELLGNPSADIANTTSSKPASKPTPSVPSGMGASKPVDDTKTVVAETTSAEVVDEDEEVQRWLKEFGVESAE